MKTLLTFFAALLLGAISASALAMPCGERQHGDETLHNSQAQVRLHVAMSRPEHLALAI
jgi:hypothetical protein